MSSKDDPGIASDYPDNLEDLSFDGWCELHRNDPRKFELFRLKVLHDMIDAAPAESQARLRGLMFKMEGEARRSKSRLGYSLRLSAMMMEMLDDMRAQIQLLCGGDISDLEKQMSDRRSAEIVPFRSDRDCDTER